jgi:ubiquitin-protein ligase
MQASSHAGSTFKFSMRARTRPFEPPAARFEENVLTHPTHLAYAVTALHSTQP